MLIRIKNSIKSTTVDSMAKHMYRMIFCGILYARRRGRVPKSVLLLIIGRFESYEPDVSLEECVIGEGGVEEP